MHFSAERHALFDEQAYRAAEHLPSGLETGHNKGILQTTCPEGFHEAQPDQYAYP